MRFLADEAFDGRIVRGLRRNLPELDLLRIQDTGLRTFHDRLILEHAAEMDRVLLTHDIRTMPGFAYDRLAKGLPMPGVILVTQNYPIRTAIQEIAYRSLRRARRVSKQGETTALLILRL